MLKRRQIVPISFLILVLLITSACQTSTLVSTLEAIVSTAEIAIPIVGGLVGVPPAVTALIVTYLQQVNIGAAQASTILAGPGTSAAKSAAVIKAFAAVAAGCNCVPAGVPTTVVNVINAVVDAVTNFLSNFTAAPTIKTAAAVAPKPVKVSASDKNKLGVIWLRAEKNLETLKGVSKQ